MPEKTFTIKVPQRDYERARRAAFEAGEPLWVWGGNAVLQRLEQETKKTSKKKP